MRNPLEVLFGTDMVSRLRNRQSSLKRIAAQSKSQLMAVLHPDQNREIDPSEAAEVSEAYERLAQADKEEFGQFVQQFLDNQGGRQRIETLKLQIRELKRSKNSDSGLNAELTKQRQENVRMSCQVRESQREREEAFLHAWSWIHTGVRTRRAHRPTGERSIPRGIVHHFRIVVRAIEDNKLYRAYEFDIAGQIRRVITSSRIDHARKAYLYKGGPTFPDTTSKYEYGAIVGSIPTGKNIVSKTVFETLLNGEVSPFLWMDQVLVTIPHFESMLGQSSVALHEEGWIVEIIDLKAARRGMARKGKGSRSIPINAKVLEYKRNKVRKKVTDSKVAKK